MGSNDLKISIVTINYNNASGLRQTIESVVDQSYPNLEYIVIDGGSTDGSKEVISAYKDQLHYWVSEPDQGIYYAMNKGIKAATGDYILFLNSGDFLVDKGIISEVAALSPNEDLVYGNLICENRPAGEEWYPSEPLTFNYFYNSTLPHPSTFIKRALFTRIGLYNEQNKVASDWEFFLVATCKYNCTYRYINKFISVFADGGISSNEGNFSMVMKERTDALARHFPLFIADHKKYLQLKSEFKKVLVYAKARVFLKNIFRSKKKGKLQLPNDEN